MSKDPATEAIDAAVNLKRIEEVDDSLAPTDQLLCSIAVSLKRIADALPAGDGFHAFVLDLAYHAGTNFEGGRRRA